VRFLPSTTVLTWIAALSVLGLAVPAAADEPTSKPADKPAEEAVAKPAPKPPLAQVLLPGADWVAVTLAADEPHVGLYAKEPRQLGVGDAVVDGWSFVCAAPCGDRVDPSRKYRVMGESIVPSIEFNVAPGSGSIALDVHARRPRSSAVTATLAVSGTVSGVGGVLLLLVDVVEHGAAGALGSGSASAKNKLDGTADTFGDVGAGMLVGGVVLGTAALLYFATGGKTDLAPSGETTRKSNAQVRLIPFGISF
jgi:hypothetical protein